MQRPEDSSNPSRNDHKRKLNELISNTPDRELLMMLSNMDPDKRFKLNRMLVETGNSAPHLRLENSFLQFIQYHHSQVFGVVLLILGRETANTLSVAVRALRAASKGCLEVCDRLHAELQGQQGHVDIHCTLSGQRLQYELDRALDDCDELLDAPDLQREIFDNLPGFQTVRLQQELLLAQAVLRKISNGIALLTPQGRWTNGVHRLMANLVTMLRLAYTRELNLMLMYDQYAHRRLDVVQFGEFVPFEELLLQLIDLIMALHGDGEYHRPAWETFHINVANFFCHYAASVDEHAVQGIAMAVIGLITGQDVTRVSIMETSLRRRPWPFCPGEPEFVRNLLWGIYTMLRKVNANPDEFKCMDAETLEMRDVISLDTLFRMIVAMYEICDLEDPNEVQRKKTWRMHTLDDGNPSMNRVPSPNLVSPHIIYEIVRHLKLRKAREVKETAEMNKTEEVEKTEEMKKAEEVLPHASIQRTVTRWWNKLQTPMDDPTNAKMALATLALLCYMAEDSKHPTCPEFQKTCDTMVRGIATSLAQDRWENVKRGVTRNPYYDVKVKVIVVPGTEERWSQQAWSSSNPMIFVARRIPISCVENMLGVIVGHTEPTSAFKAPVQ